MKRIVQNKTKQKRTEWEKKTLNQSKGKYMHICSSCCCCYRCCCLPLLIGEKYNICRLSCFYAYFTRAISVSRRRQHFCIHAEIILLLFNWTISRFLAKFSAIFRTVGLLLLPQPPLPPLSSLLLFLLFSLLRWNKK